MRQSAEPTACATPRRGHRRPATTPSARTCPRRGATRASTRPFSSNTTAGRRRIWPWPSTRRIPPRGRRRCCASSRTGTSCLLSCEILGADRGGAELGVWKGSYSRRLLSELPDLTLHLVDSWEPVDIYQSADKQNDAYAETLTAVAPYKDRTRVHRNWTSDAAKSFEDQSLDFVYVDASTTTGTAARTSLIGGRR